MTRLTERFVPPSWMPAAPPGHEAARVFEGLDVCAGLTAAGSPFDFLQERLGVCEAAVTHMQQTAEDGLGSGYSRNPQWHFHLFYTVFLVNSSVKAAMGLSVLLIFKTRNSMCSVF